MAPRSLSGSVARLDSLQVLVEQPRPSRSGGNVLVAFVQQSVPWTAEPVPVPRRLRRALWVMLPVQLVWAGWLGLTATETVAWDSPVRAILTLGHHDVLLGCAAACLAGLAILAVLTRGFVGTNAYQTAGLIVATAAGGVALLGVAALALVILLAAVVIAVSIATFTFTP